MPPDKVVAIHQPNFFPWLGYFDKIARADVFVLLDSVQFPKTARGTWTNRVQLMNGGKPQWSTAPVVRSYHGLRTIQEMEIDASDPWRSKLLKTIQANYGGAPHFDDVFPRLRSLIENPTNRLARFNEAAVLALTEAMGMDTPTIVRSSDLAVRGEATDLLIAIVQSVGGTTYLCGGGASGYQEDEKFAMAGIELVYQEFRHPVYAQGKNETFVAGLSVIDALMHCSFAGTRRLLTDPRVPSS